MFDIVLSLFLILSAIFVFPVIGNIEALKYFQFKVIGNIGYNYLQLQFFQFGIIVLFITALLSKPNREFKDKYSVFVLVLMLAGVFIHPKSVLFFGNIFLGFILYYLVTVYTYDYKWVMKSVAFVAILNFVFSVLQFFNINLIYQPTGRIDGLMLNSAHLGVYQAIALPICYAINPFLVIIPIVTILLSKSITAILIMAIWLISVYWKKIFDMGSLMFMAVFSLCVGMGIYLFPAIQSKLLIRLMAWKPIMDLVYQKPYFGYGVQPIQIKSLAGQFDNPCSIYIEILFYFGASILIPLYFLVKDKLAIKDYVLKACFIIALAAGIEKSYFDFPRLSTTVIVIMAFININKGEHDVSKVQGWKVH